MLGIHEAKQIWNEETTDSTCATFILSLRIFGRKGMIVQKTTVNDVFTHDTDFSARHVSDDMTVFYYRFICAETSKKKKTPDEKSTFLCIDGDNGGVGRVRQLEPAHL